MTLLAIAFGGAAGSVLRYLLGGAAQRMAHAGFPYGTLAVNVVGCAIVGYLTQSFMNLEPSPQARGLLIVGFCGGFTTFSAFSIETIGLIQTGSYLRASTYALASVALCLAATAAAMAVTRAIAR